MNRVEAPPARHTRAVRVLVVNDAQDNVDSMVMLLRLYGHEVEGVLGGSAALRTAAAQHPDVVLLDICMPGMDGCQVARRLREMFQEEVMLIALTAYGSEEDRRRFRDAGFDLHLVKPADPHKVRDLLREIAKSL